MDNSQLKDPTKPYGPVKVGKLTVTIDPELCIGAATCLAIAPKAYALDADVKAIIIASADSESPEAILDAAKGCPTSAITIIDSSGKQIFPK